MEFGTCGFDGRRVMSGPDAINSDVKTLLPVVYIEGCMMLHVWDLYECIRGNGRNNGA